MSEFDYLKGRTGFFSKHRTCSLISYLSNAINFSRIRSYNSIYFENSEVRSDSNSSKIDSNSWIVTVQVFVDERF
jgi:hypothetical protein